MAGLTTNLVRVRPVTVAMSNMIGTSGSRGLVVSAGTGGYGSFFSDRDESVLPTKSITHLIHVETLELTPVKRCKCDDV